jgi:ketosteroid isomerase-like protein
MDLHPAMMGHLEAVTQDAQRLRDWWAPDGVLEFPYATPDMTSRIEGVDDLVAYFDGPRRWGDWRFELVNSIEDVPRRLHVAEVHAIASWLTTGQPYIQDYVIWMALTEDGRIRSWREYWDKARV